MIMTAAAVPMIVMVMSATFFPVMVMSVPLAFLFMVVFPVPLAFLSMMMIMSAAFFSMGMVVVVLMDVMFLAHWTHFLFQHLFLQRLGMLHDVQDLASLQLRNRCCNDR